MAGEEEACISGFFPRELRVNPAMSPLGSAVNSFLGRKKKIFGLLE